MPETQNTSNKSALQFNLIAFNVPKEPITFSFFKEKRDGFVPLSRGEYPLSLWEKYENELLKTPNLYCSFEPTENKPDYEIEVDLNTSSRFAIHYFRHLIWKHFSTIEKAIISPNFIRDIEIMLPAPIQLDEDLTIYDTFTIKVQHARITTTYEMVISSDHQTRVFNTPISELGDIDSKLFKYVVLDNQQLHYHNQNAHNFRLDETFPVLNNPLAKVLKKEHKADRVENSYIPAYKQIHAFYNDYINNDNFRKLIDIDKNGFYDVPLNIIQEVPEDAQELLFTDKFEHTQISKTPNKDFGKIGPYAVPNIKQNNFKIFFIYQKSTGLKAVQEYYNILLKGGMPSSFVNAQGDKITYNKIKSLSIAIRQQFSTDPNGSIAFTDLSTAIEDVRKGLTKKFENGRDNNVTYAAIYVSPINKDSHDSPYYDIVYARIKELLIERNITSQCIYENRYMDESLNYYFSNIYAALLAKINGVPWRLTNSKHNDLIIGIGAFYSPTRMKERFIGSTFRFNNAGIFQEFDCFPEKDHTTLIDKILKAIGHYFINHGNPDKIIIHFYKELKREHWQPILNTLISYNINIPVIVATIYKTETKDIVAFDTSSNDLMPISGTYIPVDKNKYLLYNNSKYNQDYSKEPGRKRYHFPIKVNLQSRNSSILENENSVNEIMTQIYQFSRMYWKSVDQQNMPITTIYPEMIAKIVPFFENASIPNKEFGGKNLWFL